MAGAGELILSANERRSDNNNENFASHIVKIIQRHGNERSMAEASRQQELKIFGDLTEMGKRAQDASLANARPTVEQKKFLDRDKKRERQVRRRARHADERRSRPTEHDPAQEREYQRTQRSTRLISRGRVDVRAHVDIEREYRHGEACRQDRYSRGGSSHSRYEGRSSGQQHTHSQHRRHSHQESGRSSRDHNRRHSHQESGQSSRDHNQSTRVITTSRREWVARVHKFGTGNNNIVIAGPPGLTPQDARSRSPSANAEEREKDIAAAIDAKRRSSSSSSTESWGAMCKPKESIADACSRASETHDNGIRSHADKTEAFSWKLGDERRCEQAQAGIPDWLTFAKKAKPPLQRDTNGVAQDKPPTVQS